MIEMMQMRDWIEKENARRGALGHFNCAELTVFNAIVRSGREMRVPVIIGMSEKEREFFGDVLFSLPTVSRHILNPNPPAPYPPIFFNADHTKSFEKAREAVDVGFDSITFDASHLTLAENIRETKNVVRYVKMVKPQMLVEGEVGYIGEGSKPRTKIPKGVRKTTVAEAVRFVKETGVDMLAPAVGNVHGIIMKGPAQNASGAKHNEAGREPPLDIALIKKIKQAVKIPLVLHGASGNSDTEIRAAIKAGISIVHISTEIRVAWHNALRVTMNENPDEVAPYTILEKSKEAAYEVIKAKLKLLG